MRSIRNWVSKLRQQPLQSNLQSNLQFKLPLKSTCNSVAATTGVAADTYRP